MKIGICESCNTENKVYRVKMTDYTTADYRQTILLLCVPCFRAHSQDSIIFTKKGQSISSITEEEKEEIEDLLKRNDDLLKRSDSRGI